MAIFPLDITGLAVTNRITNESIPIVPAHPDITGPAAYVLLQYAPFFADNCVVVHNGTTLVRGQHYDFIGQLIHAREYIGKDLFSGIYFFERNISGNVIVSYNTLGDTWVQNNYQHIAAFYNTYFRQQAVNWDSVFGVPYQLPPIQHPDPLSSLMGTSEIVAKLDEIKLAIEDGDSGPLLAAINSLAQALIDHTEHSNGHSTGKADIGLGDVVNAPEATTLAHLFENTVHYLTSGTTGKLGNIQSALLQVLSGTGTENPLTTNSAVFRSSSFTGVEIEGHAPFNIEDLLVMQIRVPGSPGQRSAVLSTVPRYQIGYGTVQGTDEGVFVVRKLTGTAYVPWSVFVSHNLSFMDGRYLRREEFPITLNNAGRFQDGTMTVYRVGEDLFMFEVWFRLIGGSFPTNDPVVGTLPEALRPNAGVKFRAEQQSNSNTAYQFFKLYKNGTIRLGSTGSAIGLFHASGIYTSKVTS